jgi:hypothetical protein
LFSPGQRTLGSIGQSEVKLYGYNNEAVVDRIERSKEGVGGSIQFDEEARKEKLSI